MGDDETTGINKIFCKGKVVLGEIGRVFTSYFLEGRNGVLS